MAVIYGSLFITWLQSDNGHFQHLLKRGVSPEIGLEHGGFSFSPDRHRETAAIIRDHGLRAAVHLPFTGIRPGADQDKRWLAAREQLLRALEIAAVYEPDHLIGHPEFRPGIDSVSGLGSALSSNSAVASASPRRESDRRIEKEVVPAEGRRSEATGWEAAQMSSGRKSHFSPGCDPAASSRTSRIKDSPGRAWLERSSELWMEVLRETGARLFLENTMDRSPAAIMALLDTLPERAAMCFDIGHWFSAADGSTLKNLPQWIAAAAPRLGHLHLHDNHGYNDEHLGMGRGLIDFDEFFALLKTHDLHPGFTLEAHTVDNLDASLDRLNRLAPVESAVRLHP